MRIQFFDSLIDSNGKDSWEMTFELAREQYLPLPPLNPNVPEGYMSGEIMPGKIFFFLGWSKSLFLDTFTKRFQSKTFFSFQGRRENMKISLQLSAAALLRA